MYTTIDRSILCWPGLWSDIGLVLIDTLCGALGTRVVGMLRESMGSYHIPLIGMTLLCLIAAITIATLKKPGTE